MRGAAVWVAGAGAAVICGAAGWAMAGSAREFGDGPLAAAQARYSRVQEARRRQGAVVDRMFAAAGVAYPAPLLVRAFKDEAELELWGRSAATGRWVRVATWPFTAISGDLGPKRRRWDRQIPEGFYRVRTFNGASRYHLSFEIDYPNESDRRLAPSRHPGNNIFVHGRDVTNGCIPLGDRGIEQVYLAVLDSRAAGYEVPVHIAPCRFGSAACERRLAAFAAHRPKLPAFWDNLRVGFRVFDETGAPPVVDVDAAGRYVFSPPEAGPVGAAPARTGDR